MRAFARVFLFLASAVWLAASSAAQTATIYYKLTDFQIVPANVSQVVAKPWPTNGTYNGTLLLQTFPNFTRATTPSLTNGAFYLSNCIAGVVYQTTFTARGADQTYYTLVPTNVVDGSTIGAWTNVVSPTNHTASGLFAYTAAQSDARYAFKGQGGGSASNAYQSQVAGNGLTINTNLSTFVYSLALNAALQSWSAFTPVVYSNGVVSLLTSSNTAYQTQLSASNTVYQALLAGKQSTNVATTSAAGPVKPDGSTITIAADGTISAVGGGSGNVTGSASSTDATFALFQGAGGKILTNRNASGAFGPSSFDAAGSAVAVTNGFPWGVLYDALHSALDATNGIGIASGLSAFRSTNSFDVSGAATAATNAAGIASGLAGYVSTNRFDTLGAALNAALAATNGMGIASGLAAFRTTNTFDVAGAALAVTNGYPWMTSAAGFVTVITNGSSTAVIQAAMDGMTNNGVLSIQPGTPYTITSTLSITNPMFIEGNGAEFIFQTTKTNAMISTGRTYGKQLTIRNLNFNGQTFNAFNTITYSNIFNGTAEPYYTSLWTNRTGLYIEGSGGVLITGCRFYGFSGNGIVAVNKKNGSAFQAPRILITHCQSYSNYIGILAAGANYEVPGYGNADSSLWDDSLIAEYTQISDNACFGNQFGIVAPAGNCNVLNNQCQDDAIGLALFAGNNAQHGNYSLNNFNHCVFPIWGEAAGGGNFIGNMCYAAHAIHFVSDTSINFMGNKIGALLLEFTNGCSGTIAGNEFLFSAAWGTNDPTLGIVTNFAGSSMVVAGNMSGDGTNTDGSMLSGIYHNLLAGSGSGLTGLNASQLLSGIVPMAALSTNVLTATNQPFTVGQMLVITGTNPAGQPVVKGTNIPAGGTVSSVAATVPQGFSIAGSPVTTSGTLAITRTAGGSDNMLGGSLTNAANITATNNAAPAGVFGTFFGDATNVFQVNTLGGGRTFMIGTNGQVYMSSLNVSNASFTLLFIGTLQTAFASAMAMTDVNSNLVASTPEVNYLPARAWNVWVGPTNSLDMTNDMYFQAKTNCAVTNLINLSSTLVRCGSVTILNTNVGGSITITTSIPGAGLMGSNTVSSVSLAGGKRFQICVEAEQGVMTNQVTGAMQ